MRYLIEFILTTLVVYLIYYIFMINKYDNDGKLKEKKHSKLVNKIIVWFKLITIGNEQDEILTRGTKSKKIKEKDEIDFPTEVEILLLKYHVDLTKINYKKLLKIVGMTCSIDIGIIITIISIIPIENLLIKLVIGASIMIPIILISYSIIGNYFVKKGMTIKNDKRKRNRK